MLQQPLEASMCIWYRGVENDEQLECRNYAEILLRPIASALWYMPNKLIHSVLEVNQIMGEVDYRIRRRQSSKHVCARDAQLEL